MLAVLYALLDVFSTAIPKAVQIRTGAHTVISCISRAGLSSQVQFPLHSGSHLNHRRNGGNLKQKED
jgi:hypothetical protein